MADATDTDLSEGGTRRPHICLESGQPVALTFEVGPTGKVDALRQYIAGLGLVADQGKITVTHSAVCKPGLLPIDAANDTTVGTDIGDERSGLSPVKGRGPEVNRHAGQGFGIARWLD